MVLNSIFCTLSSALLLLVMIVVQAQVVLNWFWMDVQRELSVAGDVVQPVRTWGLHSISLLVKGLDAESNPTQYSEASCDSCACVFLRMGV